MRKILQSFALAGIVVVLGVTRANNNNPYPDLDDFQYANYAAGEPDQVVYEYYDPQEHQSNYQDDSNRYRVEEVDYGSHGGNYDDRDRYRVVEEGTEHSYRESYGGGRGSHYDDYDRRDDYRDVHHHHHYHDDDRRYDDRHYDDRRYDDRRYDDRRYEDRRYADDRRYAESRYEGRRDERKFEFGRQSGKSYDGEGITSGGPGLWIFLTMIAVVVVLIVYNEIKKEQARKERAKENEKRVSTLSMAPDKQLTNSGPIFFQAQVIVDGPVTDAKFGIVTREHPVLFRQVEVFCWKERVQTQAERRANRVHNSEEVIYTAAWVPANKFIDSSKFRNQKYNVNVAPDVQSERIANKSVRVGLYYNVSVDNLVEGLGTTRIDNMFKHAPVTAEFDRNGIWAHDSKNGYLVRQKNPGKSTVGDIRVSYSVVKGFDAYGKQDIWVSVCGVPDGGEIKPWSSMSKMIMPGRVSKADFLDKQSV